MSAPPHDSARHLLGWLRHSGAGAAAPAGAREELADLARREAGAWLALARAHWLDGYLAWSLERAGVLAGADPSVAEELRRGRRAGIAQYLYLRRQVAAAARLAAECGCTLLLFKGIALAERYYEDPTARASGDADLLVPTGWESRLLALARSRGEALGGLELEEEHHDLTYNGAFPVGLGEIWERASWLEVEGRQVRVPSDEDAILIQALSCCRRGFWNLRVLLDTRQVLCAPSSPAGLDAGTLASAARRWQLAWPLATLLVGAQRLLDAPVPEGLVERLAPRGARARLWRRELAHLERGIGTWVPGRGFGGSMPPRHYLLRQLVFPAGPALRQAKFLLWAPRKELRKRYPSLPESWLPLARAWHPLALGAQAVGNVAGPRAGRR